MKDTMNRNKQRGLVRAELLIYLGLVATIIIVLITIGIKMLIDMG